MLRPLALTALLLSACVASGPAPLLPADLDGYAAASATYLSHDLPPGEASQ